jgi:hypothetical protein
VVGGLLPSSMGVGTAPHDAEKQSPYIPGGELHTFAVAGMEPLCA